MYCKIEDFRGKMYENVPIAKDGKKKKRRGNDCTRFSFTLATVYNGFAIIYAILQWQLRKTSRRTGIAGTGLKPIIATS